MNKFIIILFCLASVISVQCQSSYVKEATKLLQNKRYEDALNLITIDPIYKKSVDFLMIGGISKYHISQYKEAIEDLNQAVSLGGTNPLIFKYLGHSLYALGNYEGAANYYKAFLSGVDSKHPDFHYIKNEIYRGEKNILFKNQEEYGFVDNLGKVVNTSYNEIRPVQSPNYLNKFYFSSNRTGATGGPRNKFGIR
ncbi:MAG TPA: tetratricopeptide repeat protein, partial [Saprospiraceae bacterium]|nr:tetratricopeptide repeat protein [Saprospiraceae bacterium]